MMQRTEEPVTNESPDLTTLRAKNAELRAEQARLKTRGDNFKDPLLNLAMVMKKTEDVLQKTQQRLLEVATENTQLRQEVVKQERTNSSLCGQLQQLSTTLKWTEGLLQNRQNRLEDAVIENGGLKSEVEQQEYMNGLLCAQLQQYPVQLHGLQQQNYSLQGIVSRVSFEHARLVRELMFEKGEKAKLTAEVKELENRLGRHQQGVSNSVAIFKGRRSTNSSSGDEEKCRVRELSL